MQAESVARTDADRQYAFAQGLYQQGLYDLAAREFSSFAEHYPRDARREGALFYAAQSLFQKDSGPREAALAAFREYQSQYVGSGSAFYYTSFYLVGEIHFQRGEATLTSEAREETGGLPEGAETAYEDALIAYLRCEEVSTERGEMVFRALSKAAYCATKLEKWHEAAKAYRGLADEYQSVRAQFMVGQALYLWGETEAEKLSEALKAYGKVSLFGDNPFEDDAAVGSAWCLFKQGKLEECRDYLKDRIREGLFERIDRDFAQNASKLPEAYYLLGLCSREAGDFAGAVEWLRLLVKQGDSPFRVRGLAMLAELLGESVDLTTAEGAETLYAWGQKLMEGEEFSKGAKVLERAYKTYPNMMTAPFRGPLLFDWAICYERLGCYREALAILGHVSKSSPDMLLRGRAARAEATCHRELAQEAKDPDSRRIEEMAAMESLRRSADNDVGREAEEALGTVGDFYFAQEMYARATSIYQELLSRFPEGSKRAQVLFRLGQCALKSTDSVAVARKAIPFFEQCRKEFPSGLEAVFATEQLAVLLAKMSQYESALVEYSRLQPDSFPNLSKDARAACEPVFENAAYSRGLIREKTGDAQGAISEMKLFLFQYPSSGRAAQVRLRLSRLYFKERQYQAATRVISACFEEPERCPDLGKAIVLLLQSEAKLGRGGQALARVEEVLRSSSGANVPLSVFSRVSEIMEEEGDLERARRPYQLLIERHRKLYSGMQAAATNTKEMVEKEEYAKAVHYCSDLFSIHAPERASGWTGKAAGLEESTRQAALRCLYGLDVIRRESRSATRTALWELAELNLRMGKPAAAAQAFESLAAIRPHTQQHFDVLFKAAAAWKEAGEPQKALEDFEEIMRFSGGAEHSLRAQLAIGTMWLESGDATKSLGSFLRITNFYDAEDLSVRPWVGRALFHSGVAFEQLGRNKDAKRQWEVFLRDFSREESVQRLLEEARRHLRKLESGSVTTSAPST